MLNLFWGRDNIDKEKFLYDAVKKQMELGNKIIILVPDQFTLQAEQNALNLLDVDGLIDVEILSVSRLGLRILEEQGGGGGNHLNKFGRHMLLTKILKEEEKTLETFSGNCNDQSFVDMVNNFISEMKQYGADTEALSAVINAVDEASLLCGKLKDIKTIYENYKLKIEGKFLDTEDFINLYTYKIKTSDIVKNSIIWVTGFDYFAPKTLDIIEELFAYSRETNILVTKGSKGDRDEMLFRITEEMISRLEYRAQRRGENLNVHKIPNIIAKKNNPIITHLEKEIFSYPHIIYDNKQNEEKANKYDLYLCCAANVYAEVESAAKFIIDLVREKNYAFKDILVICNDVEGRSSIIKRIFSEYNINFFIDTKRNPDHSPVINLIDGLLELIEFGWNYQTVFRLIKTDLLIPLTDDLLELENYIIKYNIVGGKWHRPFKYGVSELGDDKLSILNQLRQEISDMLKPFEDRIKKLKSVTEKTEALYDFLSNDLNVLEKINLLNEYLIKEDKIEESLEMTQIWNYVVNILNQLVIILNEEEISDKEYAQLVSAGMHNIELGLIPPTTDAVLIGTMQRTRGGDIKALIVMGANDGILPNTISDESLLSEDEKRKIFSNGFELCKLDDLRVKEESLAIYKAFSKPTDNLFISYSATDIDGKESKPSQIFEKIKVIFKDVDVKKDILNEGDVQEMIGSPTSTVKHLSAALIEGEQNGSIDELWLAAKEWYIKNDEKSIFEPAVKGLLYTGKKEKLGNQLADMIYNRTAFSPSQLEKFSNCPFSYFVNFGLKPEEKRLFEVAGREIGDVFHETIKLALEQKETLLKIDSKDGCIDLVSGIMEEQAKNYREGLLKQGPLEDYRLERMKTVCGQAVWALLNQIRQGKIEKMFFESKFGEDSEAIFPPVYITENGKEYRVEGKIDRVDILNGNYVKIIDYKSGKEKFALNEVKAGLKLQLMLYLQAAMNVENIKNSKPAGVFYFEIGENILDATNIAEEHYEDKIIDELKKSYRLDGIVLNEPDVIEGIAGEFDGNSVILPVRRNKDGAYSGTTDDKMLDLEEFESLQEEVIEKVSEIIKEISTGNINARPKKLKNYTSCTFCQYKSICNFDLYFDGCRYDVIK